MSGKPLLIIGTTEFDLYVSEQALFQMKEVKITKGLLRSIVSYLIYRDTPEDITFYNKEFEVLFFITRENENTFIFESIETLNVSQGMKIRRTKKQGASFDDPIFFKSYYNGKKIYLNKNVPAQIKKYSIAPHLFTFENADFSNGFYTSFLNAENDYIIDFYMEDGHILVTNILKPNYVRFGAKVYQTL